MSDEKPLTKKQRAALTQIAHRVLCNDEAACSWDFGSTTINTLRKRELIEVVCSRCRPTATGLELTKSWCSSPL